MSFGDVNNSEKNILLKKLYYDLRALKVHLQRILIFVFDNSLGTTVFQNNSRFIHESQ